MNKSKGSRELNVHQSGRGNHLENRTGDEFHGDYTSNTTNDQRKKFTFSLGGLAALLITTLGISSGVTFFFTKESDTIKEPPNEVSTIPENNEKSIVEDLKTEVLNLQKKVQEQEDIITAQKAPIAIPESTNPGVLPDESRPTQSGVDVTREEYDQLRVGMTYDEIVEIIGVQGTRGSSGPSSVHFLWNDGSQSGLRIIFRNGTAISIGSYNFA